MQPGGVGPAAAEAAVSPLQSRISLKIQRMFHNTQFIMQLPGLVIVAPVDTRGSLVQDMRRFLDSKWTVKAPQQNKRSACSIAALPVDCVLLIFAYSPYIRLY